jgi:hypothetical protein
MFRTALVTQDGFDPLQVHRHAAAVNQRLKNLVRMPADLENQIAAVFHLIVRVMVMNPLRFCSSRSSAKHNRWYKSNVGKPNSVAL